MGCGASHPADGTKTVLVPSTRHAADQGGPVEGSLRVLAYPDGFTDC